MSGSYILLWVNDMGLKIEFNDKSYIEMTTKAEGLAIVLCGNKNKNQLTMSSVSLTIEQVEQMITFLEDFVKQGV